MIQMDMRRFGRVQEELILVVPGETALNSFFEPVSGPETKTTYQGISMPPNPGDYPELQDDATGVRVQDARVFHLPLEANVDLNDDVKLEWNDDTYVLRSIARWPSFFACFGVKDVRS